MRRFLTLAVVFPVSLALAGGFSFAGGAECAKEHAAKVASMKEHKQCSMTKEECAQMMATARSRGWLGLELDQSETDGALTITKVVAGSPASKAGFREGDVLLSLNGVTLSEQNEEKLGKMKKSLKPGDPVTYNVRRNGAEQNIAATLGTMPEDVYTAWVDKHMKEHTEVASR